MHGIIRDYIVQVIRLEIYIFNRVQIFLIIAELPQFLYFQKNLFKKTVFPKHFKVFFSLRFFGYIRESCGTKLCQKTNGQEKSLNIM